MNISPLAKRGLLLGTIVLFLGVLIGAFGAHGLKDIVEPEKLVTFETGVRYQFYHGFGLLILGLFSQLFPQSKVGMAINCFLAGIILFSFNCYLYAVTELKPFAMAVPFGGFLFLTGWGLFIRAVVCLYKL